ALVFLAWLLESRAFLWAAFAAALVFASGLSLSGHSAADVGSSWKSELADWVHLPAASLWLGGLVQLALVVWPKAPEPRRRAVLLAAASLVDSKPPPQPLPAPSRAASVRP